MSILAFTSDLQVSHTAYRITRPFAALSRVGLTALVVPLPSPSLDGIVWRPAFEDAPIPSKVDVLVLHRAIIPPDHRDSFLRFLKRCHAEGITVVYDTDDDIFSDAWAEHLLASAVGPSFVSFADLHDQSVNSQWILSAVDGITVSTGDLAEVVGRFTRKPICVVPNALDLDAFVAGLVAPLWPGHISLGWAAGYRPEADAQPVAAAWSRIAALHPTVRFVVAGHPLPCLMASVPPERLKWISYRPMTAYPSSMQVSIGCCGAAPSAFNASRSPIKAWEFARAGAAVVYSPSVYSAIGTRGLPAVTADEWFTALDRLIRDPQLRADLQRVLSDTVEARHALTANLWRYSDAYRSIAGTRHLAEMPP